MLCHQQVLFVSIVFYLINQLPYRKTHDHGGLIAAAEKDTMLRLRLKKPLHYIHLQYMNQTLPSAGVHQLTEYQI